MFNKDLYRFYDEITIKKPDRGQDVIFKIKQVPINLAKMPKSFEQDNGINPFKYTERRFTLPKAMFYNELFSFRESEKTDANLLFMLGDFTKYYKRAAKKSLEIDYLIKPEFYAFGRDTTDPKPKEPDEQPLITWSSLQSNPGPDINATPVTPPEETSQTTEETPAAPTTRRKKK